MELMGAQMVPSAELDARFTPMESIGYFYIPRYRLVLNNRNNNVILRLVKIAFFVLKIDIKKYIINIVNNGSSIGSILHER
jgi:hypothetical protein